MNEDKLKKYIIEHREEFDTDIPPSRVWSSIEHHINPGVTKKSIIYYLPRMLKVAAAVLLLLSAGAGMGVYMQQQRDFTYAIQNPAHRKEYREASSYFAGEIDSKLTELKQYKPTESVMNDLNQIDQISSELKLEIVKNPDQDQGILVQEMIRQYQQKLNVLNKILEKLQESDKKTSSSNYKPTNDTLHL
ncbi:MAG: hypothetical protein ABIR66_09495 [Saprospiraceae bacterium]